MKLRDYQENDARRIIEQWSNGVGTVMYVLPTGGGKCLGKGTPILMFDGTVKNVEHVVIGDSLMGPDSKPRKVLSLARGVEQLYTVTPIKGDPYVVNESHILSLKTTGDKSVAKGVVVNKSVTEWLESSKWFKHVHKGWRSPVSWGEKKYPTTLPPYLLGLWLGDGTTRNTGITTADAEIVDYIHDIAGSHGWKVTVSDHKDNKSSTYSCTNRHVKEGSLLKSLRNADVINNKHVPLNYKTGSDSQRLELLAGLLDSDGHYNGKSFDVLFKIKQLADDTAFVARSLGFSCYVVKCNKTCTNTGVTGEYFRMSINGDLDKIPNKIERQKARPRRQKKSVLVTGITVEPLHVGDYFGFEIDGDHLFMLGDFTVTHNTVCLTHLIKHRNEPTLAIAHRQELVKQMSCTLAAAGIYHRLIASDKSIKLIVAEHLRRFKKSFYDPNAMTAASSVQTIDSWAGTGADGDEYIQDMGNNVYRHFAPRHNGEWTDYIDKPNRMLGIKVGKSAPKNIRPDLRKFLATVKFWVGDEGHHYLKENVWGRAIASCSPNCKGLLVTATPMRADGKGLGRSSHGLADCLVVGPPMRELINRGYLTDYRIIIPPNDIDTSTLKKSKTTGDFTPESASYAVEHSSVVAGGAGQIVGDVVQSYQKYANGKLGLTFVPTLHTGDLIVEQYRSAGVSAELIHGATPANDRDRIIREFAQRKIMQLVNVDVLGEGTDIPAVEVVSFVRLTASYGLYVQQFGRVLRLLEGKERAIILDHVGNVTRHGLPDAKREWSLEPRELRGDGVDDSIPVRTCTNIECFGAFERYMKTCPHCGEPVPVPLPAARQAPEFVDGDLYELDEETLARMRGDVEWIDKPTSIEDAVEEYRRQLIANYTKPMHVIAHVKRFVDKYEKRLEERDELFGMVTLLRDVMAWYAGHLRADGLTDSEIFRKFYLTFGVDWLSAQALPIDKMQQLYINVSEKTG